MSRNVLLPKPEDIEHVIEARKHLVAVRDNFTAKMETQRQVDKIVEQLEALLGY